MRHVAAGVVLLALMLMLGAGPGDEFKREGDRDQKDKLEGKVPPALSVEGWVNIADSSDFTLESVRGKVVVVDFWGVWCGPCRAAMPHLKELLTKHQDAGLVVIGIHTTNQGEKMPAFAKEQQLPWPIAVDIDSKTVKAWGVDSYPDYYLIDRAGNLRVADLQNGDLDRAVEALLKEPAPVASRQ